MRRSKLLILSLVCLFSGAVSASDVVATITSYNAAELTGDGAGYVAVDFINSNHSKGQITANNVAQMTFSGLPKGRLHTIDVFIKSNAKSGKGALSIKLNGEQIAKVEDTAFPNWPGSSGYSTAFIPITFSGNWNMTDESDLVIEISASENSLTWEKTRVLFEAAQPDPYIVTLSWLAADGSQHKTEIKESAVGTGVVLPDCEVKSLTSDKDWTFVGWSKEEIIDTRSTEPNMYSAGSKFYPTANQTLYAVYSDTPDAVSIIQTTDFQTGEYALVMACTGNYYMAYTEVIDKKIYTHKCNVVTAENGYRMTNRYVPVDYRYQVDFEGDSLTIKHIYTGSNIGHSGTKLADNKAKWSWRENKNHSLELSFDGKETESGFVGRVLWLSYDDSPYFDVAQLNINSEYEYILLFDVSDAPTSEPTAKWTSYPFGWDAIKDPVILDHAATKTLRKGTLYIERDGVIYTIFGNKISTICN